MRKLDLRLDMDDRIALLGQNGNGKSTFIRLLSDRLQPREGRVKRVPRLRIGYFSQDQEESLDYRSEEHTSELQSHLNLVCRLLLEKKKKNRLKQRDERLTHAQAIIG